MLTLRNCSFVDPTTTYTSMAVLARTSPRLGPSRPWSARALIDTRDRIRVLRVGVLVVVIGGLARTTTVDPDWLDRLFSDRHGVAAFVRQMSGGRRYLEWQAFPATTLMTLAEKDDLLARGELSKGTRDAARRAGIPVDAFDHWIWVTDEGLSSAGSTTDNDSFMGAKDFTVSVVTHELMHRLGVDGHADASVANDYGDGCCIMGVYQRSFVNPRLPIPVPAPQPMPAPIAGPGLSAPYERVAGWLAPRNVAALPLDAPIGTRVDLFTQSGAPTEDDDRTVAATLGSAPAGPGDPAQLWIEYRQARGFDAGVDGAPADDGAGPRAGVIHLSRAVIDPAGAALNPGKVRTFLVSTAPAVVGARSHEFAGRTARVEVVSTEQPLVRIVLDPPVRYAYLFKGATYVRYDRLSQRTDAGYPLPIGTYWNGMAAAGFGADLDAALPWFGQQVYFFKGSSYVRYDLRADRVEAGYPRPIAGSWPGLAEAGFGADLDAAVNWGDGYAYFFKGDQYLRYHIVTDRASGPISLVAGWPGLGAAGFDRDIDACLPWYDGKAYLFRGDRYLAYDMLGGGAVIGQPTPIDPAWPGLGPTGFGSGVRAAFCAPPPEA
ncbi:MAG TPA: hemopexin repeat-containing protein [Microlunatus sp.]